MRAWRKHAGSLLRVLLSVVALAILFRHVGGEGVVVALRDTNLGLLLCAWLLFLAGIVVRVFRWRALLYGLGLRPPLLLLLRLYLIGGFFNAFLPSGFGGDVIRVLELGQAGDDRPAALGTVLVDRLTGILSLMAMGLVVLPFAQGLTTAVIFVFVAVAVSGLVVGALLLEGTLLRRLTSWLPASLSLEGEGKLAQIYAAVTGCGARAIWQALAFSTVFNGLNVVIHWLAARAVGIDLALTIHFVVVPLLSLALLLPISVGGLGARDWVAQMLLAPTAVSAATTAAWTLSVWAVTAAAGLVGGAIYLWQGLSGLARRSPQDSVSGR